MRDLWVQCQAGQRVNRAFDLCIQVGKGTTQIKIGNNVMQGGGNFATPCACTWNSAQRQRVAGNV